MADPGETTILSPRGLLLSLLAQLPLVLWSWPPTPAFWMTASGAAALVLGVVLNVWSERLVRRGGVGVCPFSPATRLIRSGPYSVTRDPMYLGLVLLSAGVALATGVVGNLWSPALYAVRLHGQFVLPEEAFLRDQLGPAYEDYQRHHPRWLGLPSSR